MINDLVAGIVPSEFETEFPRKDEIIYLPIVSGVFNPSMIGKKCDLGVRNNIQGAMLDFHDNDMLLIVSDGKEYPQFGSNIQVVVEKKQRQ